MPRAAGCWVEPNTAAGTGPLLDSAAGVPVVSVGAGVNEEPVVLLEVEDAEAAVVALVGAATESDLEGSCFLAAEATEAVEVEEDATTAGINDGALVVALGLAVVAAAAAVGCRLMTLAGMSNRRFALPAFSFLVSLFPSFFFFFLFAF